jgi:hypothetical protein
VTNPPPVVRDALAAARESDPAKLDGLVDWPLSAVGAMTRRLTDVDAADRGALTRRALAELNSADPATRSASLRSLRAALATAVRVEPADAATSQELLTAIRAPVATRPSTDGLSTDERSTVAALARRAEAVVDTYVLVGPDGARTPFAVRPDGARLVILPA